MEISGLFQSYNVSGITRANHDGEGSWALFMLKAE